MVSFEVTRMLACENSHPSLLPARVAGEGPSREKSFGPGASYKDVTVDDVRQTVAEEMDGPGKLLGYRVMQKRIRQEHELNVPRDMVHAAMQCVIYDLDPEGLEARSVGSKKR